MPTRYGYNGTTARLETPPAAEIKQATPVDFNTPELRYLQQLTAWGSEQPQKQRQMAALEQGPYQPSYQPPYQPPAMAAAPPAKRKIMLRKPAPYGYPESASGGSTTVDEDLLQAYLSQGWRL